eukprot:g16102.t1
MCDTINVNTGESLHKRLKSFLETSKGEGTRGQPTVWVAVAEYVTAAVGQRAMTDAATGTPGHEASGHAFVFRG